MIFKSFKKSFKADCSMYIDFLIFTWASFIFYESAIRKKFIENVLPTARKSDKWYVGTRGALSSLFTPVFALNN